MKAIRGYVRPVMRDAVLDALAEVPHHSGVGVSTVSEFGWDADGDLVEVETLRLEVEVSEAYVEQVCQTIRQHARTGNHGHVGDGKLLVVALDSWERIEEG